VPRRSRSPSATAARRGSGSPGASRREETRRTVSAVCSPLIDKMWMSPASRSSALVSSSSSRRSPSSIAPSTARVSPVGPTARSRAPARERAPRQALGPATSSPRRPPSRDASFSPARSHPSAVPQPDAALRPRSGRGPRRGLAGGTTHVPCRRATGDRSARGRRSERRRCRGEGGARDPSRSRRSRRRATFRPRDRARAR
jgi:hypothetical protein